MKEFIVATVLALILAGIFAATPMPPQKVPIGVGTVTHAVEGPKRGNSAISEIQITDDKRIYRYVEKIIDVGSTGADFPRYAF